MKKTIITTLMLGLLLSACSSPFEPIPDAKAAISATRTAEQSQKDAILAGIAGTQTASAPQTAIPTQTAMPASTTMPTPTPSDQVDYYALTEEELVALIVSSVNEAVAVSEAVTSELMSYTSDGTLTEEEIASAEISLTDADKALAHARELMAAYVEIYGDYAAEMLDTINQMETDLSAINTNLEEMHAIFAQGAEAASGAVDQINQGAEAIQEKMSSAQDMAGQLENMTPVILAMQEENALNMVSNLDAENRLQALDYTREFSAALRQSMSDRKISPEELDRITQQGAEARAALLKFNMGEEGGIYTLLDQLVSMAARGEYPRIIPALDEFDQALPSS